MIKPITSQQIAKEYDEISGYLTNEAKSIVMTISGDCPVELKKKWSTLDGPKKGSDTWA